MRVCACRPANGVRGDAPRPLANSHIVAHAIPACSVIHRFTCVMASGITPDRIGVALRTPANAEHVSRWRCTSNRRKETGSRGHEEEGVARTAPHRWVVGRRGLRRRKTGRNRNRGASETGACRAVPGIRRSPRDVAATYSRKPLANRRIHASRAPRHAIRGRPARGVDACAVVGGGVRWGPSPIPRRAPQRRGEGPRRGKPLAHAEAARVWRVDSSGTRASACAAVLDKRRQPLGAGRRIASGLGHPGVGGTVGWGEVRTCGEPVSAVGFGREREELFRIPPENVRKILLPIIAGVFCSTPHHTLAGRH